MSESIDIKKILDIAIEMEDDTAARYKELAFKVEELKPQLFYTPHENKIVWNKEIGFYKELEEKIMGIDLPSYFYQSMSPTVTNDDSYAFYKNFGNKFTDDVKGMLLEMSKEEEDHAEIYKKFMYETDNADANEYSFKKEIVDYLEKHTGKVMQRTEITTPRSIIMALEEGVNEEQKAIDFYSGMLPYANKNASEILERIIKEEQGHKAKLKSQIKNYKLLIDQ